MNGLRVYLKPRGSDVLNEKNIFYSRRGNGPYYLWLYEETVGQWRVSRVNSANFSPQLLSMASWKAVPPSLQTRLGEHYLE